MAEAPPEGWYPDPTDPAQLRWWDGVQWTEHTHGTPTGDAGGGAPAGTGAAGTAAAAAAASPASATAVMERAGQTQDEGNPFGGQGVEPVATPAVAQQPAQAQTPAAAHPAQQQQQQQQQQEQPQQYEPQVQGGQVAAHEDPASPAQQAVADAAAAAGAPVEPSGRRVPSISPRVLVMLVAAAALAIGFGLGRMTAPDGSVDTFDAASAGTEAPADTGAADVPATEGEAADVADGDTGVAAEAIASEAQRAAAELQAAIEACAAGSPDGTYLGCNDRSALEGVDFDESRVALAKLEGGANTYLVTVSVIDGPAAGGTFTVEKTESGDTEKTCVPLDGPGCEAGTW